MSGQTAKSEGNSVPAVPSRRSSWACGLMTGVRSRRGRTRPLTSFAGQRGGLLHPSGKLSFVELVVLMDVESARWL